MPKDLTKLMLDTTALGKLCHSGAKCNAKFAAWFESKIELLETTFFLPEISDYELRRELLRMSKGKITTSLKRLDSLCNVIDYIPLNTQTMHSAAALWAEIRSKGKPTAPDTAIDGDVILAAQARQVGATVLTANIKHLSRLVEIVTENELI